MTIVFTVVFSSLLGNGDPIGYAASVLTGMAVWGFLRDSALNGCRCFMANEAYIRQSPIPYTIYTLRTVLGQAIHSLIALAVVVVMIAIFNSDADRLPARRACDSWSSRRAFGRVGGGDDRRVRDRLLPRHATLAGSRARRSCSS